MITKEKFINKLFNKEVMSLDTYIMFRLKEKELKALLMVFLFLYGLIRLIFIIQKQAWQFVPYQIYGEFF